MTRIRRWAFVILAAMVSMNSIGAPRPVAGIAAPTLSLEPIPTGFKTYSLFLVCNPAWLEPDKTEGLSQLYTSFESFGRAIGQDNVAVWFWKSQDHSASDGGLASAVDVERSERFCQAWKLTPSKGPHIVITSTYPDERDLSSALSGNYAVYELGDMPAGHIAELVGKLTDELVLSGRVSPATLTNAGVGNSPGDPPKRLWVSLLTSTQKALSNFGCAWSFKVSAGPVTANLRSCASE